LADGAPRVRWDVYYSYSRSLDVCLCRRDDHWVHEGLWQVHRQQRRGGSRRALMARVEAVNELHETPFIQQKCSDDRVSSSNRQTVDCSFKKSIPTSDQIVDSV
jgi:uncharacterized ferritin-like protein (DUF455 family)